MQQLLVDAPSINMKILNLNQNIDEIKSNDFKKLKTTLLVLNSNLSKLYEIRQKKELSLEELLKFFTLLLQKKIITIEPNLFKHTTLYQCGINQKLNLTRCHFRCDPMVWHHWKRLANHYGVSMCYLFSNCLKKVELEYFENVGTPTEKQSFHNLLFFEITNFTRFYSHRWIFTRLFIKKSVKKNIKLKNY